MSEELREVGGGNQVYYKYTDLYKKFKKDGEVTVLEKAKFLGTQENNFNADKADFLFYLDGQEHVLNSCGHLAFKMSKVNEGDLVTAIYAGKEKLQDGKYSGTEAHQWRIFAGSQVNREASPFD